jgi:hypothetical protein
VVEHGTETIHHFKGIYPVTLADCKMTTKNCQMCGKSFKPLTKRSKVCPDKECKRLFRNWQADQYRIRDGKVRGEITRNCDFCGEAYTSGGSRPWGQSQQEGVMLKPKYCSAECAKQVEYTRKRKKYIKQPFAKGNCVVCGTEFTTNKPNSKKRRKTCSPKCANQVGRAKQEGTSFQRQIFVKHCAECGSPFEIFKYARANGEPSECGKPKLYCSRDCHNKNRYARDYVKVDAKRRKKVNSSTLNDQYVIEQIQKRERRNGSKVAPKSEVSSFAIESMRIQLLVSRGEKLDKSLYDAEAVKEFEIQLENYLT